MRNLEFHLELTDREKKELQAKGYPLSKEINCPCCGQKLQAKLVKSHVSVGGVALSEGYLYYPRFCEECQILIEKVEWFKHHRKDPTPKLLQRDLRKKIRQLEQLKP